MRYLNNTLSKYRILDYKIIKTTEKKIIFKDLFGAINSEIYTYTSAFIILYTLDGVLKLNISNGDNLDNLLDFYNIEKKDFNIPIKTLSPVVQNSIALEKYNKFNYKNCNDWFERQKNDITKNNPLSFNYIMNGSLYKQELCDGTNYYIQYSESSDFMLVENTKFKLNFKINNCMFDEAMSRRVSLLVLENDRNFRNKSFDLCSKTILFSQKSMSIILDVCASMFYASRIYLDNSIISKNDVNKRYLGNFDLIFDPFENIKFDAEGSVISRKFVVKNGYLVELLSNNLYSKYLNLNSSGNNSIYNHDMIGHQKIKIDIKNGSSDQYEVKVDATVCDIKISKFFSNTGELYASVYYQEDDDNELYKDDICMNVIDFFKGIISSRDNYSWNNNVFCADTIVKF